MLVNTILFVSGLNIAFGIRSIRFEHYMITLVFHVTHFYWGERSGETVEQTFERPDGNPGFFHQHFFINGTYIYL